MHYKPPMALRTFRFNPSLGGFGRESSSASQIGSFLRQANRNNHDSGETKTNASSYRKGDEELVEADAFAQIVKELIDNAMDACRSCHTEVQHEEKVNIQGTSGSKFVSGKRAAPNSTFKQRAQQDDHDHGNPAGNHIPRRVLVKIVPEESSALLGSDQCSSEREITGSASGKNQPRQVAGLLQPKELVRVTVTDNGCGMKDIQACVDPFYTSKAHNSGSTSDSKTCSPVAAPKPTTVNNKESHDCQDRGNRARNNTAGRYGIGLTLCLLHAQRLVPHSSASIQSATAEDSQYTQVQCWVDTDRDAVRCWPVLDKIDGSPAPALVKRYATQSGTSISLLLPGGATAAAAWPRLASFFAKFQLSLDLPCSLQVLAPSLSHMPLYIQPVQDEDNAAWDKEATNNDDVVVFSSTYHGEESPENGRQTVSVLQARRISTSPIQQPQSQEAEQDFSDWIDPTDLPLGGNQPAVMSPCRKQQQYLDEDEGEFRGWIDPMNVPLEENALWILPSAKRQTQANKRDQEEGSDSSCTISTELKKKEVRLSHDDFVRSRLHRAAQKFLGREIALRNVAHARVPIQQTTATSSDPSTTGTASSVDMRPHLEIGFIVHQHHPEDSNEWDYEHKQGSGASAVMSLVRMVNSVPLLDSAQAVACGLVQGLLEIHKVWHSFGLNVAPHPRRCDSTCLPMYQVNDSDQVAPFFQHNTHKQHHNEGAATMVSEDEEGHGKNEERVLFANLSETSNEGRNRSAMSCKRKFRRPLSQDPDWLRPAHSRLGHILVICQLHASPTCLPLPTLCKGRLPLDDMPLMTALQVAMTRCLRQLQKSNPTLFLSTKQLKTVERNVRFVPAIAQAVTSIVTRSTTLNPVVDRYLKKVQQQEFPEGDSNMTTDSMLQALIERRIRRNVAQHAQHQTIQRKKSRKKLATDKHGKADEAADHEAAAVWDNDCTSNGNSEESSNYQEYNDETFQTKKPSPLSAPKRQGKKRKPKRRKRIRKGKQNGLKGFESCSSTTYPEKDDENCEEFTEYLFEQDPNFSSQAIMPATKKASIIGRNLERATSKGASGVKEETYQEYTEDFFGTPRGH